MTANEYNISSLNGRNRRLLYEWRQLEEGLAHRSDISFHVRKTNAAQLPICYLIEYHIQSLCGVTHIEQLNAPGILNEPLLADRFLMQINLPENYPQVDAPPDFFFLTHDEQNGPIPHPWHPNIRFFGDFAGHVCLNMTDTYTDLLWGVKRVASYLHYEIYHAIPEPPYPEDLQVAKWVVQQGEPNGWII